MNNCQNICKICKNLIISTSVDFDPTTNSLDITIPDNGYRNCEKVCIVIAQTIPSSTTINALVNIVVGGVRFPLQRINCTQVNACELRTRTKYSTRVVTNTVSGAFRLLGKTILCCPESLETLPIPTTTVAVANANIQVANTTPRVRNTTAKKGVETNE